MSAVAVGPARLTLDAAVGGPGWDVTVIEQSGGSAQVTRTGDAIVVRIGDHDGHSPAVPPALPPAGLPDGTDPSTRTDRPATGTHRACCTTVSCQPGGRVVVDASAAPPALLVRSGDVTLVPSTPGEHGVAHLAADERLLVLSAEAYDTLPPALVILLRELPDRVLGSDPAALLETLFEQIPVGCGALIAPAQS